MDDSEIHDMFSSLGPVVVKRMFGGKGIYHRGLIFALQYRGDILLKGDELTAPLLEAAGGVRWTYEGRRNTTVAMPYWSLPDDALDDSDAMARWARLAFEAALRAPVDAKKSGRRKAADEPPDPLL